MTHGFLTECLKETNAIQFEKATDIAKGVNKAKGNVDNPLAISNLAQCKQTTGRRVDIFDLSDDVLSKSFSWLPKNGVRCRM